MCSQSAFGCTSSTGGAEPLLRLGAAALEPIRPGVHEVELIKTRVWGVLFFGGNIGEQPEQFGEQAEVKAALPRCRFVLLPIASSPEKRKSQWIQ